MWTGVALASMTANLGDEVDRVAQVRVVSVRCVSMWPKPS